MDIEVPLMLSKGITIFLKSRSSAFSLRRREWSVNKEN
jgi:hypothetical protein